MAGEGGVEVVEEERERPLTALLHASAKLRKSEAVEEVRNARRSSMLVIRLRGGMNVWVEGSIGVGNWGAVVGIDTSARDRAGSAAGPFLAHGAVVVSPRATGGS